MWLYESGFHLSAITVPSIFHSNNGTKYHLRSSEPIRSAIAKHQRKRHPTQSNIIPGTMLDDSNQMKAIKNRGEEMHFDLLYQTTMTDIIFVTIVKLREFNHISSYNVQNIMYNLCRCMEQSSC